MKRIILLVMITLLVVGVCGCMRGRTNPGTVNKKDKTAEDYLITKYGSKFSFLSNGDDVWSSKSKSLIFSDEEGREFTVKENSGYFTDNYASVLFDTGASKDMNAFFGEDTKIYVNTMSVFSLPQKYSIQRLNI